MKPLSKAALAHRIRQAALGVEGVTAVGSASPVQVATYGLPGELVKGVRISDDGEHLQLQVHVVARLTPLIPLAHRVRKAVIEVVADLDPRPSVDVYIDDLDDAL